jgi:2-desacetyl-2-hydroxyethyl bacteriochlorophyllide A dehydrogenase
MRMLNLKYSVNYTLDGDYLRVAVIYGPGDIRVEERDIPEVGPEEVLVNIKACGICGSDLHSYRSGPRLTKGRMLGHEYSGVVVKIGENVRNVSIGDRVGVEPLVNCGRCSYCLSGLYHLCPNLTWPPGFAEYQVLPWRKVFKLPENVSFEEAALLDCVAVAFHAVRLSGLKGGETVTVLGAGSIGLLTMQIAKLFGASKVYQTGTYDAQLKLAKELGADAVINVGEEDLMEKIKELTGVELLTFMNMEAPKGVDYVFEAVGGSKSPIQDAINIVKRGGTIVVIGSPRRLVDLSMIVPKEVKIMGSWSYGYLGSTPEFQIAINLISSGKVNVKKLITHVFPLERIKEAFDTAADKTTGSIKVIVKP